MVATLVAAAPALRVLRLCLPSPWVLTRRTHTDLGAAFRAAAPRLVDVAVADVGGLGLSQSVVKELIDGATASSAVAAAGRGGGPCLPRLRRRSVPTMSTEEAAALTAAAPGLHTLRLVGSTDPRSYQRRPFDVAHGHPLGPLPPLTRGGGAAALAHVTLIGDTDVVVGSLAPALAVLASRLESLHLGAMTWDVAALLGALPTTLS